MRAAWDAWVRLTREPVDSRPLLLVRVAVTFVVACDMLAIVLRGAWDAVLYPRELGGIVQDSAPWFLFDGVVVAGPALWATVLVSMAFATAGVATRPALVVGLLAYAQLGHFWPPGDRGVDHILRTALVILIASAISDPKVPPRVARWAVDLVRLLVVCVFLGAAAAKGNNAADWLGARHPHELYAIMASPVNGRLNPAFWFDHQAPFVAMGWATLVGEFLVLAVFVPRLRPYWAVYGALLHLGIAATIDLGIFSFGMLALYPVLFSPWTEAALDRLAPWTAKLPGGSVWQPPPVA